MRLEFAADLDGRTFLRDQFASYPFHVCKALYQDADLPNLATLYAQSSSGGLYEGDSHSLELIAREGAQLHFTTQASTIVHSMPNGHANQTMRIDAEENAYAEYLPDPQILFPRSNLHSTIYVTAAPGASVVVSDAFLIHDPSGNGGLPASYASEIVIAERSGRPLAIDRLRMGTDDFTGRRPGVLGLFTAHASILIATRSPYAGDIQIGNRALGFAYEDAAVGVSTLPNSAGVLCRLLASDGASLKRAMHATWCTVRRVLMEFTPSMRRK